MRIARLCLVSKASRLLDAHAFALMGICAAVILLTGWTGGSAYKTKAPPAVLRRTYAETPYSVWTLTSGTAGLHAQSFT